ncbi:hypothetical protein C0583_04520 [Candidatus Parcubacteria bacterium]|nr:MAG: hypothetical protein C0583_04520 [Candidatus Parcubacteria bacterium]
MYYEIRHKHPDEYSKTVKTDSKHKSEFKTWDFGWDKIYKEMQEKQKDFAKSNLKIRVCTDYIKIFKKIDSFDRYVEKFRKKYNMPKLNSRDDSVDTLVGADFSNTGSSWLNRQTKETKKKIEEDLIKFIIIIEQSFFFMAWMSNYIFYGKETDIKFNINTVNGLIEDIREYDPMGLTTLEKKYLIDDYRSGLLAVSKSGKLSSRQKEELKFYKEKIAKIKNQQKSGFRKLNEYIKLLDHGKKVDVIDTGEGEKNYKLTHRDVVSGEVDDKNIVEQEMVNSRKRKQRLLKYISEIEEKVNKAIDNL